MALTLVHFDGFDDYTAAQAARHWTRMGYLDPFVTGRYGTGLACPLRPFDPSYLTFQTAAKASGCFSFGFKLDPYLPSNFVTLASFYDTVPAASHLDLRWKSDSHLAVTRNGTELATGGPILLLGRWYHIAFAATIDDVNGKYDVWLDGVKIITGTGDTRNGGNASFDKFVLGNLPQGSISSTSMSYYDDVALFSGDTYTDADFPGDCAVKTSFPTGDSATYKQFTPSTGTTHYSLVDESAANDDTDYCYSGTPGQIDAYTFPALTGTGTVRGVMNVLTTRMDDAGPRSIAGFSRLSGTDVVGTTQSVSSSYAVQRELSLEKPGGGAWTITDVNNAELGVKEIA